MKRPDASTTSIRSSTRPASRASSFRTFYFEPKVATNKIRDDAVHLILGIRA